MSGDLMQAAKAFEEASRLGQAGGNLQVVLLAMRYLAKLQIIQGQLHRTKETCQHAVRLAVDSSGKPLPVAGVAYVGRGDLLRERNDLKAAAQDLALAIDLCQQWGNVEILAEAHGALARVRLAQGDLHSAGDALEQANALITANDMDPRIVAYVYNGQVRVRLSMGDLPAAQRWMSESRLSWDDELTFPREDEFILLARVLIAQGELELALRLLERLQQSAEGGGRMGRAIEILVLEALAHHAMHKCPQALDFLEQALSLAEPEGYIRMFLDEGPPMTQLLREARASSKFPGYLAQLLAAGVERKQDSRLATGSKRDSEMFVEPLTERELEVLRLIAEGFSNSQIAQSLTITVGTAKRHVNNIYGKLNVGSRTQAVARARELGLL
jgi:LuxR family maltose regulon positive regulatory protein